MRFTDWPQELIFQVLHDEAIGLKEKCSLARVNRPMHEILVPFLYQSIRIHLPASEAQDVDGKQLLSLQKTLSENPSRALFVQHLSFSWESYPERFQLEAKTWKEYPHQMKFHQNLEQAKDELLSNLTKLQTLTLEMVEKGRSWLRPQGNGPTYGCPFLVESNLKELRELRFRGLPVGLNTIALSMCLPKLKVLEIQRLGHTSESIAEQHLGMRSSVRELHLGPFFKPNANVEQLPHWTSLERLSYDLGIYMGRGIPLYVGTLSQLLAPHTDTLVDLNLSGSDYSTPPTQD